MRHLEILIQPLDHVESSVIEHLAEDIPRAIAGAKCWIAPGPMPIPALCYNSQRNQYDSNRVLGFLNAKSSASGKDALLGVCNDDLYTADLNFVFGQAGCPGTAAIISICRLKQEFYGLPADDALFLDRALKEAVHEIGHCLGLHHCRNASCVMFFSNSLSDTDGKGSLMCDDCLQELAI